jgi:lysozyme
VLNRLSELSKYLKAEGLSKEAGLLARIRVKIAQEVYIVMPGDNPGKIAQKHYERFSYHKYITDENGIRITDDKGNTIKPLQVGQRLLLGEAPESPNTSMNYSANLVEFIKREEELRLSAYDDNGRAPGGYTTIGYGHNLGPVDSVSVSSIPDITEAKAEQYLKQDLKQAADGVSENTHVRLNQHQFDALVSLTFNIGRGALANSELLATINSGNLSQAGRDISGAFISLKGHKERRARESKLFLEGTY